MLLWQRLSGRLQVGTLLSFGFGVVFLCVSIVLAVVIPTPTDNQATTFKVTLALAAAGIAAGIPGLFNLEMSSGKLLAIKSTGAFAAFLIVFFFNPVSGSPAPSTAASRPDPAQAASALSTPSAIAMSPQFEPTKTAIAELAPTPTERESNTELAAGNQARPPYRSRF